MNTPNAGVSEIVRESEASEFSFPASRGFFLALLVYFALQIVIRTLISGTADLDESEQLVLTQKFAWGYGSQPPLYTWLQMIFFKMFGVSIFALALLKNLLLLCIYVFTYFNARLITRSNVCGILAAVSLLFIPEIAWESQRDLTHSILAAALVAITLFVFLRLRETRLNGYAVLGFCVGLGILSKYNYVVFILGLVLSGLTLRCFRPIILNRRIWISALVCLVVLSPHLLWAFRNHELLATTAYKFHQENEGKFIPIILAGLGNLFRAVVLHVALALAVFVVIFRKTIFSKSVSFGKSDFARLFARQYGFVLAGLILTVLVFRVTGFKDRWFEPIFISLPLLFFAIARKWVQQTHAKQILKLACAVALGILVMIPGRIFFAEESGRMQLLNAPFSGMKKQLRAKIPEDALVLAESKWVGGNLRLLFPQQKIVTPELARLFPAKTNSVVVWIAGKGDSPRPTFVRFLESFAGIDFAELESVFVTENYQHFRKRDFRVGVAAENP